MGNMAELLTPSQVAARLSVSLHTLQAWRSKCVGPKYVKLAGGVNASVRYRSDELEAWLARNPSPVDDGAEGNAA